MIQTWLNPRWRVWLFLSALNLAWLTASWLWLERETWLWVLPIALSINALLLTYDQVLSFRVFNDTDDEHEELCQSLQGQDAWGLVRVTRDLSERLGVTPPRVYLIRKPCAQIFTYARTRKSAKLFVTKGALDLLTPRQLRAVLIFELIAIRHSYHILNYWLGAWLDILNRAGKMFERAVKFVFGWSPPLAAWCLSPWLAVVRLFMISRSDFARLDRETIRHVDHPEDLAFAIWKMESYAQTQPWPDSLTFAHMFIVSPFRLRLATNVFKVQPPLQSRIKRIAGRYPL